ncbi:MAG: hypothetical protein BGO78_03700 [Chloroflexi bacterium 44-23]|nr:MAG: hypothetical protein BGO78_03700 [Chloroflexi bacterium 44-23]
MFKIESSTSIDSADLLHLVYHADIRMNEIHICRLVSLSNKAVNYNSQGHIRITESESAQQLRLGL